jgi:predicted AlkP superfamily pyrophosphatase or phosphodiesterase
MGLRVIVLAAASCAAVVFGSPRLVAEPVRPKLVVLLVVDQMRADYVDHFKGDWTRGLKRLVTQGAWFRHAAYPYLTTVTCAGHATIATGALPSSHGVFQNAWWDRQRAELVSCTQDPNAHNIGYGARVAGGESGVMLTMPTFADVLRTQRDAHVVTLAIKARSAIMPAGHGGDAVTWLNETGDTWVTSSAFADGPLPAVKAFLDANPLEADFGKTWTRKLPERRYQGPDDGDGEVPPKGWNRTFPHELNGSTGAPDIDYRIQWQRTPFADAYIGRFAAALVESLGLGKHGTTDLLSVSFSSPDMVGHAFGPQSQEVQDIYLRLDETIGTLLDRLDALVGKNEYIVALTADHGVTPLPEQLKKAGRDAGRLDASVIVDAIEKQARAALGGGPYVARANGNDVYFAPGMYEKLTAKPEALRRVVDAVSAVRGIARVFRSEDIRGGTTSEDPLTRAAALSYFPGRSGDLVVAPKPGWIFAVTGATHGSANADDQRVPIVFMGTGVKAGHYQQPATPADIAPTLAAICGVTLPRPYGHALAAALKIAVAPPRPTNPQSPN